MKTIKNLKGLLEATEATSFPVLKKMIYKGTSCGAWISELNGVVAVGSIVEGVDQTTKTKHLKYPFHIQEFWDAVEATDHEATQIWNDTHGCENCGEETETGHTPINPDCESCGGEGTFF